MKRVVIPLLALLLAACVLCAGVSAGDITIGKSSSSGSGSININPAITNTSGQITMSIELTSGTLASPVTISVTAGSGKYNMTKLTATYDSNVSAVSIGGFPIVSGQEYASTATVSVPLSLTATVTGAPTTSSLTATYNGSTPISGDVPVQVSISSGRTSIKTELKGTVTLSTGDSLNFTVPKYVEPEPNPTDVPVPPTSSGGGTNPTVAPTPSATPVKLPPAAKVIEETVTIPDDGKVTLGETEVVKEITVAPEIVKANPGAQVDVTEGNAKEITLPVGVTADEVAVVLEVSVIDKDGKDISIESEGSFTVTLNVPAGKIPVVGHYNKAGVWENCEVISLGNGQYEVKYSSLSPFAVLFIEAAAANPLLSQPTATPTANITAEPTTVVPTTAIATTAAPSATATKSPVPFFGLLAGLAAAGLVLRRK